MKTYVYRACLVIAPLLFAGAAVLYARNSALTGRGPVRQLSAQRPEVIAQPVTWIPFTADLRHVDETSGEIRLGRFYRASDGSTRSETGSTLDAIDTIAIKNISTRSFYLWSQDRGWWTAQPMDLPQRGWLPVPRILTKETVFVADKVERYNLVRSVTGNRVVYEAPQLNMFELTTIVACATAVISNCGTWYFNIRQGEPPNGYFKPRSGEQIVQLTAPGGIVRQR
jgi:hypothetical protein